MGTGAFISQELYMKILVLPHVCEMCFQRYYCLFSLLLGVVFVFRGNVPLSAQFRFPVEKTGLKFLP